MNRLVPSASAVVLGFAAVATAQVASPTGYTSEYNFPAQMDWVDGEPLVAARGDSILTPTGMTFGEGADFWFGNSATDPTVPGIDGQDVDYIAMNGIFGAERGLRIDVYAPGNSDGGNGNIFEFTFVFDVFVPAKTGSGLIGLWQGNATNTNNGEFFLDTANQGFVQNCDGALTEAPGSWNRGEWVRVVHRVDYDSADRTADIFVNGVGVASDSCAPDWLWGWPTGINTYLLTDDSESAGLLYCANVALVDGLLDDAAIEALGGPDAAGVFSGPNPDRPTGALWTADCDCTELDVLAAAEATGSYQGVGTTCVDTDCPFGGGTTEAPSPFAAEWRFDQDGGWTDGDPLIAAYGDSVMDPANMVIGEGLDFWFSNTADTDLPQIDGQDVDYLTLNNVYGTNRGLRTFLAAPGNGDGAPFDIFEFTLVFDVLIPATDGVPEGAYQALWQGNASNSNDAEFFLRCDTRKFWVGGGCGQVGGEGLWPYNEWFRVVHRVNYNAAERRSDIFVNGVPVVTDTCGPDWLYGVGTGNPVWFLADNGGDGDVLQFHCANLAFVDVFMSEADIFALGGPNAAGVFSGVPAVPVGAAYDDDCGCSEKPASEALLDGDIYMGDDTTCMDTTCPIPSNDDCAGAQVLASSQTSFDSTFATDSGYPDDSEAVCSGTAIGAIAADLWFAFVPANDGLASFSTCSPDGFDTDLLLYGGSGCGDLVLLACNGDSPDTAGCQTYYSSFEYDVIAGETYFLRVGGYGSASRGAGVLTVEGVEFAGGSACPGDFNGDDEVNGADFGEILAAWGECPGCSQDLDGDGMVGGSDIGVMLAYWGPCPGDPCDDLNCDDGDPCTIDSCFNGVCSHQQIPDCNPLCGDPKAGDCDSANGTPGCGDPTCCGIVCNLDSYCCEVEWDEFCASIAGDNCP